jgi:hypothetical protein
MSETDFIFAWLLAARAATTGAWTDTAAHIAKAKEIYKQIKDSV